MPKQKKCLILYQSISGNTEKVAFRFKKAFEKNKWQCDMVKIDKKIDVDNPPFDFNDYDFLCAGSGVYSAKPGPEISDFLYKYSHRGGGDRNRKVPRHKKIVPGPKAVVVFVTYAGAHLGPKEAEPSLSMLDLEIEHLKFKCVGRFSCPGQMGKAPTPKYWHGDITGRPNERDLQKAEIFIEEIIEAL